MRRKTIAVAILLMLAGVVSAQVPISYSPEWCGFPNRIDDREKEKPKRRDFAEYSTPGSGICDQYTIGGWEEPMILKLGEGASDYRELIELAVKKWNEALRGYWRDPLIQIVEDEPKNFSIDGLPNTQDEAAELVINLADFENVIYFKAGDLDTPYLGLAQWLPIGDEIVTVDLYINTREAEEWTGLPVFTKKVIDVGPSHGVYAMVDSIYAVTLHELGHAVGLLHLPASGNVMATGTFADGVARSSGANP